MLELQDCHEAYQVLLKIIKVQSGNKKREAEESENRVAIFDSVN